jgi:hypothetical protein
MIRKFGWNTVAAPLVALVALLVVACAPAQAQVKPWKITGNGVGPLGLPLPGDPVPRPHSIVGNATHLGRHTGEGSVLTDTNNLEFYPDGTITGEFGSADPFVFTGANDEILTCNYGRTAEGASTPGTFELVPVSPGVYVAHFIAEFVPVPEECTGKFAGVTGSWVMYAVSEPFVLGSSDPLYYSWEGAGSLTFAKGQ